MAVRDIEYVELYASDKQAIINYLVPCLGFARVAESVASGRDSTLLRQGSVQLIVTAGPATADFVHEHGDGIVDIAFGCDDVGATLDAAVAAGGVVLESAADGPTVSGFGEVRHTLLPRTAAAGTALPPGYGWVVAPGTPPQPAGLVTGIDHIAAYLEAGCLADCIDFYRAGFGLDWYSSDLFEVADHAMASVVVRSRGGGVTLTMHEPDWSRGPRPAGSFLDRNNGAGVEHLALRVNAIVPSVGEWRQRGVEFLDVPAEYYDTLSERHPELRAQIAELRSAGILADIDDWGYLLQVFTHSPHERNTLFYELIQRRDSWGFSSANNQALYEVLENGQLVAG
jgi:4-hydroxymandelate synthase